MEKIKAKTKRLINSFKYAFEGIFISFKKEKNMKIHIIMAILVVILGMFFKITKTEWIICIFAIGIIIASELFNTAIETIVDMITEEKNEKAKIAKDVSAGAVLVNAIATAIIGTVIFMPKMYNFFLELLDK